MPVENILAWVAQWMVEMLRTLDIHFRNMMATVLNWLTATAEAIFANLNTLIISIQSSLNSMIIGIEQMVAGIVDVIASGLERIWQKVLDVTVRVLDSITAYINDLIAWVVSIAQTAINQIQTFAQQAQTAVVGFIEGALARVVSLINGISQSIQQQVEQQLKLGEQLFETVQTSISKGLETLLGGADSLISQIGEKLGDIREGFAEAVSELIEAITGVKEDVFEPIKDDVKAFFADLVAYADPDETEEMTQTLLGFATSGNVEQIKQFVSGDFTRFAPVKSRFWNGLFFAVLTIVAVVPFYVGATSAQAEVLLQGFRKAYPYQLLSPADVTGAWRRGLLDDQSAIDMIQRQGYSAELAKQILSLSDILPPEPDLLAMWHRGLIGDKDVDNALFERGIKDEFIGPLKAASFVLPPVQDLITMAVREVFSPATAERFGQFEDFPQVFADEAAKQGLTPEWARNYWAAHWALPSPQHGFEMLHRGVINQEDLNLLMRALDVMPFWRDKITQIAYSPYTRVDIRRMHKVGVLDDTGVKRAYLDLGYNEEKASALTVFTKRLNAPKGAEDDAELGRLSRSVVIGFYRDGLLTDNRARELLVNLGHTTEAANLYIQAEDMESERRERSDETKLILDLATSGIIPFIEAQDRLARLGLTEIEVKKALAKLLRSEETKTKIPSRSEGEAMVKAGVITMLDYEDLLSRLGYGEKWRDAYKELLLGKLKDD